jgi:hypothetical protein
MNEGCRNTAMSLNVTRNVGEFFVSLATSLLNFQRRLQGIPVFLNFLFVDPLWYRFISVHPHPPLNPFVDTFTYEKLLFFMY